MEALQSLSAGNDRWCVQLVLWCCGAVVLSLSSYNLVACTVLSMFITLVQFLASLALTYTIYEL